ncbi:MAG: hypothetical protein ACRD8O_03700 [Bryobacteraceae bacterium]
MTALSVASVLPCRKFVAGEAAIITYMPRPDPDSADAEHSQQLILWIAIALSIVTYFVVAALVSPTSTQAKPTLDTALLIAAAGLVAASFPVKSYIAERIDRPGNRAGQRMARIVAVMMCDVAAVLGLVVKFVTGSPLYYVPLLLGFAGVLLHYPRREE